MIAAYAGSAGAGGVMLGLGADIVAARDGIVLNPYYDIGLYGSELHTYTLPRRVGPEQAQRLIDEKLPVERRSRRRRWAWSTRSGRAIPTRTRNGWPRSPSG